MNMLWLFFNYRGVPDRAPAPIRWADRRMEWSGGLSRIFWLAVIILMAACYFIAFPFLKMIGARRRIKFWYALRSHHTTYFNEKEIHDFDAVQKILDEIGGLERRHD